MQDRPRDGWTRPPLTLCDDAPDWHAHLADTVRAARRAGPQPPERALREWVTARLGGDLADTHAWHFTRGTGATLDWLFRRFAGTAVGAVLPTYQRIAAGVGRGGERRSVTVEPEEWDSALFSAPVDRPAVLMVNPLHSNPTAVPLGASFRQAVAEYAEAEDILLVEDDAFRLLGVSAPEPPALVAAAPARCVYLGSFTKLLGWPRKFGYVGVPHGWTRRLHADEVGGAAAPHPTHPADFAALLAGGGIDDLVERRRQRFARRRSELTRLLARHGMAPIAGTGGPHLLVPTTDEHARERARALIDGGFGGLTETAFHAPGQRLGPRQRFVRLGMSDVVGDAWPKLLRAIAQHWASAATPT